MKNKPYKIIALSAIITASNILPAHTLAAEIVKPVPAYKNIGQASNQYDNYSLGPEGLKEAMEKTGSNTLVMELYALTILKQSNANFNGVTIGDGSLKTKVINHQNIARNNATQWLDILKPKLITINQNIVNYNTKFQSYYETLVDAVNKRDKIMLSKGLTRLSTSITENKERVDQLLSDLRKFRNKLTTDTQSFKEDSNELTSNLAATNSGIPLLQQQVTTYNEAISKYNKILIGSAVATTLGPIAIIGGTAVIATGAGTALGVALIAGGVSVTAGGAYGIIQAQKEMDTARLQIQNISMEISQAQLQVATLTNIKNQTEYLTNTIDIAISALQNISNQWETLGKKYGALINNITTISPNDLEFIKQDLTTAKGSWENISKFADNMYANDIKIVNKTDN
ncbi:HBL/NHE enterotoxin family protein [Bacillus mycoides]|uniref:non-hemolytic enterotoxin subunit B n=1 Tax=Bacillus mycoides TaxID=1405 RepID=UPI003D655D9B